MNENNENLPQTQQSSPAEIPDVTVLLSELRTLIHQARERAAYAVNAEQTLLYWNIGVRIRQDILKEERAPYGERIVSTLSAQLAMEYGRGFKRTNLLYMIQFAEVFPDRQIVHTLSGQLAWSHFKELLPLKKPHQREFYAEMCRLEKWSVRTLRDRINGMLYERTGLAKKPADLIDQELAALRASDQMTPDLVFRDPYLLSFLGLTEGYSEKDLESGILRDLESFLLELGGGFTFVARQKRMTIDDEDFYLDLLFYHRILRRLVAIELKIGKFSASHKGQMELYLRWLDRYEKAAGEEAPIGLILCSEKSPQQIELLQLDQGDIRVAQYLTEQLPSALLERKLSEAVHRAQEQAVVAEVAEPDEADAGV